jgi:hypothetical protein
MSIYELSRDGRLAATLGAVVLTAYFFARVEVEIEGEAGWAANLPTWRIEQHPLLDLFWGGRAMTGYHAWMFSFIALVFHFPLCFMGLWSARLEAGVLGATMLFWIVEDYLWFVVNPAFGWRRFKRAFVPWHKRWLFGAPVDYWLYGVLGALLLRYAY